MACLSQLGSVPAAYAVVAGGRDWPLPPAVGLSNNHVIALRQFRQLCYVSHVACVALDGNPAYKAAKMQTCWLNAMVPSTAPLPLFLLIRQ